MVNIHKCKDCNQEIYYMPEFTGMAGYSGYIKSFKKMNMDKSQHDCSEFIAEGKRWADYEAQLDRAEKNSREAYDNWKNWTDDMMDRNY